MLRRLLSIKNLQLDSAIWVHATACERVRASTREKTTGERKDNAAAIELERARTAF